LCESFICGNGVREGREECDGGSECHPTQCKILGICGDGTVNNHSAITIHPLKSYTKISDSTMIGNPLEVNHRLANNISIGDVDGNGFIDLLVAGSRGE
jgi:hypothetical protein